MYHDPYISCKEKPKLHPIQMIIFAEEHVMYIAEEVMYIYYSLCKWRINRIVSEHDANHKRLKNNCSEQIGTLESSREIIVITLFPIHPTTIARIQQCYGYHRNHYGYPYNQNQTENYLYIWFILG